MTRTTRSTPAPPAVDLPAPKERRRLREAKALSQAQVAEIVGVTRETVRSWELGRTTPRGRKRELYARLLATITTELTTHGQATPVRTPPPSPSPLTQPTPSPSPSARPTPSPSPPARPTPSPSPLGRRGRPPGASGASPARTELRAWGRAGKGAAPGGAEPLAPAHATTAPPTDTPHPTTGPPSDTPHPTTSHPTPDEVEPLTPTRPATVTPTDEVEPPTPTPSEAFDDLYTHTAPSLLRQTYLLTGRHRLSHESVERAFHLAWQRWPEVATDRDPTGWVRAAAYEYAMSPWHRLRPSHKHTNLPPTDTDASATPKPNARARARARAKTKPNAKANANATPTPTPPPRALLEALLQLPPPYRRTLVLYDGLGLDLPETAAETEATTPATAHRLEHARTVVAQKLPELAEAHTPAEQSALLQERLSTLAAAQPVDALPTGDAVRTRSERKTRFWTRAAIAFTTLIVGATAFTLATAPTQYEAPRPPGEPVGGVPAHSGPQRLTVQDQKLRAKLRAEPTNGPERLVPQTR
ncbi:helix-turn-helix domain-containing protein [Streptomyces sp. NBC_00237]|uniref:helix-turn-helix domain-containing protein n=1 Tax=Streptomyces sp. NBC_00237 TaxID=2975687 RepID=UPI002257EFF1|nr:helix-turn-helix domain-containing protein [Streptomyces sp. NBC_00237]MCX5204724.1 helix-turn-helix domain-containing protein [Streptomyces sp. NBC_00237]